MALDPILHGNLPARSEREAMSETKRNELYGLTIRLRKLTEAVRSVHNAVGLPLVLSQAIGSLERAEGLMLEARETL